MNRTLGLFSAAAGAAVGLYARTPLPVKLLALLMALDYLTGVSAAALGRSRKSESGALSSKTGFIGLARKAMILSVVLVAMIADRLSDSAAFTGAVTMFYSVNEALSILENAVLLGVPIPQKLRQALDVARHSADSK